MEFDVFGKKNKKELSKIVVSWITLTNNEAKNIINVIKSLEDREILLKETARKNNNQQGGPLNFFCPISKSCFTINKKMSLHH